MLPGVRLLLVVVIGGGAFLVMLIATGAAGLHHSYVQAPFAAFVATGAIWPLVRTPNEANGRGFVNWLAYNAAIMLVLGLVIYAVSTWTKAQAVIHAQ